MGRFSALTIIAGLLGVTSAAPTKVDLAPRCGTTYYPTILQQLVESDPDTVYPNNDNFHVQRKVVNGALSDRVYQFVGFEGIPAGSYGCQLAITFPQSYPVTTEPADYNVQMNVTTALNGLSSEVTYPNAFTWNNWPALGTGLFGTVTAAAGSTAVINSEACPPGGGNLAFLFEVSRWVEITSSVDFTQSNSPLAGVYLTANC
ncbi:hypothetical protein UCRPA7_2389 [Phaeoacremonium minimum UCRPA7]|uniref:Ubiquitin 3 binding protein But2 C-terminal domain-containing protein n=1 Tax=Phaeoacremonium minimum (strain UCR-PA7) TaxID=1286976 RepID=R8BRY4_PHAM7|nr:hypothetical protein UCRPA7_2389 [Phaeoacremonium minimum UCRPA7]EOO02055.1 hypothetical protein UCRPA7_2389 [Phaeoacremonium minimum UCRPA7]